MISSLSILSRWQIFSSFLLPLTAVYCTCGRFAQHLSGFCLICVFLKCIIYNISIKSFLALVACETERWWLLLGDKPHVKKSGAEPHVVNLEVFLIKSMQWNDIWPSHKMLNLWPNSGALPAVSQHLQVITQCKTGYISLKLFKEYINTSFAKKGFQRLQL